MAKVKRNKWQRIDHLRHLTEAAALFEGVAKHCEGAANREWFDVISITDDSIPNDFKKDMLAIAKLADQLRSKYEARANSEVELMSKDV